MNNYCPLGFECVIDTTAPLYRRDCCANKDTCHIWAAPWELPYWQKYHMLIVSFEEIYKDVQSEIFENPITSQYDWRKYFAEYGFAEAVDLPYYFRDSNNAMIISIANDNICREEIEKTGYANSIALPLQSRKEYYSPDTYEGFDYQEVDWFFCGDEAINALNAGYADAINLFPSSLDNQRWEHYSTPFYE
jgi:hypothetical protein